MRRPRFGGWIVGVWLLLQASPAFSATLLFLSDRETPLFQAWSRDARFVSMTPVTLPPPGATAINLRLKIWDRGSGFSLTV